jgi:hypothetical protein
MKAVMILTIALALAAGTLFSPAVADAITVNNLAKAVAAKVCGSDQPYQNGCRVYMSLRLQEGKNPSAALSGTESVCDYFHKDQPKQAARCKQGAQYLRGME